MKEKISFRFVEYLPNKKLFCLKLCLIIILIVTIFITSSCIRDNSLEPKENNLTKSNQMIVYPNIGNVFYYVNYKTFEFEQTKTLEIPDSIGCFGLCLSTNKDFLIFAGELLKPPHSQFIISYNIENDTIHNIFPTGLDSVGAPRITAAYFYDNPGLFYLYSHNVGLYSIDFLNRELNRVSSESGIPKTFYNSPDKNWIILRKYYPGYENDYTELEFYNTSKRLNQAEYILNQNDQDGINIKDLVISDDNKHLYISYLLSKRRAVYQEAYFGGYDIEKKVFYSDNVILPWSDNPYYMAYNLKCNEVYMVGDQDKFYIINTSSDDYIIKDVIDLPGKIPSPSRILLRPDKNVAFVSCVYNNFILAIDLNNKTILKTISIESPYLMLLLE